MMAARCLTRCYVNGRWFSARLSHRTLSSYLGRQQSPVSPTRLSNFHSDYCRKCTILPPPRCLVWQLTRRELNSSAADPEDEAPVQITCSGCGSELQFSNPTKPGFIPREKMLQAQAATKEGEREREMLEETVVADDEDVGERAGQTGLICKRCFSLKHYNTALDVTLGPSDYLQHLSHLRQQRALLLLVVDVVDFPTSLFPNLNSLVSPDSRVLVVANKVDLLPREVDGQFWRRLESMILEECRGSSLSGCEVTGVVFTSVKSGEGLGRLSEAVAEGWGNRGDVYLLGCTNVGKSSLFNSLLQSLCGVMSVQSGVPGEPPTPTVSHWPGTTLGVLKFPLLSVGRRRRLLAQQARADRDIGLKGGERGLLMVPDVTSDRGVGPGTEAAQNRFWFHDTPGAVNDAQLINFLTTTELKLALPKKRLKPRTFILQPGQCLMVGGLARLDYLDGSTSAYFTVFAAQYLPVHVTRVDKADVVWAKNLGTPLLKVPFGGPERLDQFPSLEPCLLSVTGSGWRESAADVVLSSAGWIAITARQEEEVSLMAHTPGGRGVHLRHPSLLPTAVTRRGKRSRNPNRRAGFTGH